MVNVNVPRVVGLGSGSEEPRGTGRWMDGVMDQRPSRCFAVFALRDARVSVRSSFVVGGGRVGMPEAGSGAVAFGGLQRVSALQGRSVTGGCEGLMKARRREKDGEREVMRC